MEKDVSNNLYYTSGKIGIGVTKPNYDLNNINCFEINRNGTPLSSVLSLFLPLTGGILTGNLTGTTIAASYVSATNLAGSGTNISNLDYNNIVYNKPDLTIYAIKSDVDDSLNIINNTLTTKQNLISVSSPLIKDVNNNITIDLSSYSTTGNDPNYLKFQVEF